jgi:hypothetical protein
MSRREGLVQEEVFRRCGDPPRYGRNRAAEPALPGLRLVSAVLLCVAVSDPSLGAHRGADRVGVEPAIAFQDCISNNREICGAFTCGSIAPRNGSSTDVVVQAGVSWPLAVSSVRRPRSAGSAGFEVADAQQESRQMSSADIEKRGRELQTALRNAYHQLRSSGKMLGLSTDVTSYVLPYLSPGISFEEAEKILTDAGCSRSRAGGGSSQQPQQGHRLVRRAGRAIALRRRPAKQGEPLCDPAAQITRRLLDPGQIDRDFLYLRSVGRAHWQMKP